MKKSIPLVYKDMLIPFVLIILCFAAWGAAANMTDPLVKVFSKIFTMSTLQSTLVQSCYYGAYFCLALPAAFINKRFSYKVGVLTGLGCAISGAFLFYPASQAMTYGYFLAALFILAGGLSILETSANPYVMDMGPEENATRRLNFAQAFNPVGTNIGVFLAATLILPQLNPATAADRAVMALDQLRTIQAAELAAVMTPYVGMACVLLIIWVVILFTKTPVKNRAGDNSQELQFRAAMRRLLSNPHYRFGVIAQFFNVAAQTCIWTFTIQYVMDALLVDEAEGGKYLQISMVVFLVTRFMMTWIMGFIRPSILLVGMAVLGSLMCAVMILIPNFVGVCALVTISACLSLMFPTIYGVALHGLGQDTKFGAAGLVMAILGGALLPLVQGGLIDLYGATFSYIVPALCFIVVAGYGVFDLTSKSRFATVESA